MKPAARLAAALVPLLPLLLLASAAAQADAVDDIVSAHEAFLSAHGGSDGLPQDLEGFLLRASGTSLLSLIDQVEGNGNRADLRQTGNAGNSAAVFQGYGNGNEAELLQQGERNLAVLTQTGNANRADALEQRGNDNTIRAVQDGDNNSLSVQQYADFNRLDVRQVGTYNFATVVENGNAGLDITQSNLGGAADSQNVLSVNAIAEPGYSFNPISIDGPGQTTLSLCTGGPGFCTP